MCTYDSCRLLSVVLPSFVENPFTKEARFNFELLKQVAYKAQKLMDDIVDLENEKIERIYQKIQSDPEADEIKQVEKDLWKKIAQKLIGGRRTGLVT